MAQEGDIRRKLKNAYSVLDTSRGRIQNKGHNQPGQIVRHAMSLLGADLARDRVKVTLALRCDPTPVRGETGRELLPGGGWGKGQGGRRWGKTPRCRATRAAAAGCPRATEHARHGLLVSPPAGWRHHQRSSLAPPCRPAAPDQTPSTGLRGSGAPLAVALLALGDVLDNLQRLELPEDVPGDGS